MAVSLAELAKWVGGAALGDGGLAITGAATLSDARPGEITFINSADKAQRLGQTAASAVVVPRSLAPDGLAAIQVDDVAAAFAAIVRHFRPPREVRRVGVSPRAVLRPSARLGVDVDVYPGATIGDDVEIGAGSTIHAGAHVMAGCKLGEQVTIFSNAVLYENTVVGPRSTIHANVVLGGFGFGYTLVAGRHQLSAQLGHVEIGADVEIGAGTTVDRGTYGATVIGEGTKIDNLVMIAHNCRLGRHNLICSQVAIAGSTTTGDYVTMAGQVGVRDHVHIGDRAVLGGQAGVPNDVAADSFVLGTPARPEREQKRIFAAVAKLPDMRREFKALRAAVARLEAQAGKSGRNAAA
ncbi:MAG TPA: UDP-3-O-(3-hydroxymyristoyl)glucosamine N-acyltransferase [Pirellulales bacterium]|nr:UDP-3-O-(3-hydroxymyristoyl)glucosamine N-acyltransferase [Pirellulales bacterium]